MWNAVSHALRHLGGLFLLYSAAALIGMIFVMTVLAARRSPALRR